MVEDDVEYDAQPRRVRGGDQFNQVAPVAEMWINVEEVLNAVSVIRIEVAALLKDRPDPDSRYAEPLQIIEFRTNPTQRPTLPPLGARFRPAVPPPHLAVGQSGASGGQVASVEQGPRLLPSVAEPIRQQEVERLV